jgi:hypothetical protein
VKFMASYTVQFKSERLVELEQNKAELLLCLVKSERYKDKGADYAEAPWALRLHDGEVDHTVVDLSEQSGAFAVTMDGRLLKRRDAILQAAAAAGAVPAPAKPVQQASIRAPAQAEAARQLRANGVFLFVPVDSRLESQCRSWLKAPESEFRVEGVKTLRHFKSDEAIQLLKGLLDDSQSVTEGEVKSYPVRKAAYEVLKAWAVTVKPPITEEPAGQGK